jgi:transcriptional regulator with GAF, ATPase, and Fis domain
MAETTQVPLEVLERLRHVIATMAEAPDARALVGLALDQAIALVGAERGFVLVLVGIGPQARYEVAAARNLDQEDIQHPDFKVSRSVVNRVTESGKAEVLLDAGEDPLTRNATSVKKMGLRSIICVPLRARGRTLGVLYVDHRHLKSRFGAKDLAVLETFATPAALFLDSAQTLAMLGASRDELARRSDELARRVETIEQLRAELSERYRERAREVERLRARDLPEAAGADGEVDGVIARSPAMRRVLALAKKVAPTDAPVLVLGESGVGKEVVARALHALSSRGKGPFVAENCAALSEQVLESELFGHEKGAFTGAHERHVGLFESARGGTFLLDEVGEMSPNLQAKLLRVLQEREIRRVGGTERIQVDVRVIAATHRDLEAFVAAGKFRADLFYRLNVLRLEVPPLRERREDVAALVEHFASASAISLEPQARELLLAHEWPGNVRELENEMRRLAAIVPQGGTVRPGLLSASVTGRPAPPQAAPAEDGPPILGVWKLDELEKEMILRALRRAHGNKALAARLLGLAKSSFYHRLEHFGLHGGQVT